MLAALVQQTQTMFKPYKPNQVTLLTQTTLQGRRPRHRHLLGPTSRQTLLAAPQNLRPHLATDRWRNKCAPQNFQVVATVSASAQTFGRQIEQLMAKTNPILSHTDTNELVAEISLSIRANSMKLYSPNASKQRIESQQWRKPIVKYLTKTGFQCLSKDCLRAPR